MASVKRFLILFITIVWIASCSNSEKAAPVAEQGEGAGPDQPAAVESPDVEAESISLPAVNLRDDARVWGNEDGKLSDESLAVLDMGTAVTYLGMDRELESGGKSYLYSKVKLEDGTEGWLSTVRLAKNCMPVVVMERSGFYSKPYVFSPLKRDIPAGQIGAVSLEKGRINGFAQITLSYYDGDSLSYPETGYVKSEILSSFTGDIEVAKLVLKAFRIEDQRDDFLRLAFTQKTAFSYPSAISSDKEIALQEDPDPSGESDWAGGPLDILAINPIEKGEALPFYLAMTQVGDLRWIDGNIAKSAGFSADTGARIEERPRLASSTGYDGTGVPSVNLYNGLSLRTLDHDENGNEILSSFSSLEMGETVYALDGEKTFENITFIELELPEMISGWSSKSYIAVDSRPAVVLNDDVPVFNEPKLTALTKIRIRKNQVIAVHNGAEEGFVKISYVADEDNTLEREVYIQSGAASLSYQPEDVYASLLLYKINREEDREMKDILFENALSLSSYLDSEWGDIYYGDDGEESSDNADSEAADNRAAESE